MRDRRLLGDFNMDINNSGFKVCKRNWLCECFMRPEMHSACLVRNIESEHFYFACFATVVAFTYITTNLQNSSGMDQL